LRRAADDGFEGEQITLARWLRDRYLYRESEDLPEAIKWYERSYQQGHSVFALAELACSCLPRRAGTARDYTKAHAYYTVAKELGRQDAATNLQKLDEFLQPAIKISAAELANSISAGIKPVPRVIWLQTAETETAGPSPWPDPTPRPASP
jgi:hypothetical protein